MTERTSAVATKAPGYHRPLALWPDADRKAWVAACKPSERLKRGGAAGHLKQVTRETHERAHGRFLGFLKNHGLLKRDGPVASNVTPENVEAYIAQFEGRIRSTTACSLIWKLRRIARYMNPNLELAWLAEIAKDFAEVMRPRSKFDRFVLAERLIEAGLTLMGEAENSQTMTKRARAIQFRNGLMVALLAFCLIRRKNFAALEIGRTFVKVKDRWWIILPASETKEGRADERPVNDLLTTYIERYLAEHRAVLARPENPSNFLWLSRFDGSPISDKQVWRLISNTTLMTVGVAVSPHLFRTAGASSAAVHSGDKPHLGSALLHHAGPETIQHYNFATGLSAGESFRQVVRNLR